MISILLIKYIQHKFTEKLVIYASEDIMKIFFDLHNENLNSPEEVKTLGPGRFKQLFCLSILANCDEKSDKIYDIVLSQDVNGTENEAKSMTFRTLLGHIGEGVTFENIIYQGYYLSSHDEVLILHLIHNQKKPHLISNKRNKLKNIINIL